MLVNDLLHEVPNPVENLITAQDWRVIEEAKQIVIWGTGRAGEYAFQLCCTRGFHPVCFGDNNSQMEEKSFHHLKIYGAETLRARYPEATIIISSTYREDIRNQLEKIGYEKFVCWDTHLLLQFTTNLKNPAKVLQNNADKIEQVYHMWADEASRRVYRNLLKYRLNLDRNLIDEIYEPNQYFHNDVVPVIQGGVFVDCGANVGDTLKRATDNAQDYFDHYYAVEPDDKNYQGLCLLIEKLRLQEKVTPVHAGAWNKNTTLCFTGDEDGLSGTFHELLQPEKQYEEIPVISIDSMLKGMPVQYITMDIEGAEYKAIEGARQSISEYAPVMMISAYHFEQDLWELPLLLCSYRKDYSFFLRHHFRYAGDTVLYAK